MWNFFLLTNTISSVNHSTSEYKLINHTLKKSYQQLTRKIHLDPSPALQKVIGEQISEDLDCCNLPYNGSAGEKPKERLPKKNVCGCHQRLFKGKR